MKPCKDCPTPAKCQKMGMCAKDMKKGAYPSKGANPPAMPSKMAAAMGLKK